MVVLITGGAGFLGAALTRRLLRLASSVVVAADAGLVDLLPDVDARLHIDAADLGDAHATAAVVARADVVVHLSTAPPVGAPLHVALRAGLRAGEHVLSAAAGRGKPVVLVSAAASSGSSTEPRDVCDAAAVSLCEELARTSGLRYTVVPYPGGVSGDVGAADPEVLLAVVEDVADAVARAVDSDPTAGTPPMPPVLAAISPRIEPDAELMRTIERLLRSGQVTNDGPELRAFEQELAQWLGASDLVAVGSGSAALLLGLTASLGSRRGACVLPAFTYVATLSAVRLLGLEPILCDIAPDTWTLDPDALGDILATRSDVVCVVPVTTFGVPPDLARLRTLADGAGASLVLDNAHGVGTTRAGRRLPDQPDVQAFSLHATKVLPAIEGGFIVARDAEVLAEARRLRAHGLDRSVPASDPLAWRPGYNARLDEVRAAVGRHSLARLDGVVSRRRTCWQRLRAHLAGCGAVYQTQAIPADVRPNGQDLAVLWRGAAPLSEVIDAMSRHGVEARRYFHPVLNALDAHIDERLPVTDDVAGRVLCLPLYSRMTDAQLARVERATAAVAAELG